MTAPQTPDRAGDIEIIREALSAYLEVVSFIPEMAISKGCGEKHDAALMALDRLARQQRPEATDRAGAAMERPDLGVCSYCHSVLDPLQLERFGESWGHVVAVDDGHGNAEPSPCGPVTAYYLARQPSPEAEELTPEQISAAHKFYDDYIESFARAEAAESRVAELEAQNTCTLGVGDGSGKLFVHGDYESIKAAQAIIFQAEEYAKRVAELEAEVARLKEAKEVPMAMLREIMQGASDYGPSDDSAIVIVAKYMPGYTVKGE